MVSVKSLKNIIGCIEKKCTDKIRPWIVKINSKEGLNSVYEHTIP